jgi:hypothetical protein
VDELLAVLTPLLRRPLKPGMGIWSGGSGLADRETGRPVTAQTTFAIASITEAFVGALAVKLAPERRVSLEERLSRTLPNWPYAEYLTPAVTLDDTRYRSDCVSRWLVEQISEAAMLLLRPFLLAPELDV